ncbi:MAG: hypothetical protein II393_00255 [Cytophagales bacterium]|nr:hypothetical protein [Cytophagales bacterium]
MSYTKTTWVNNTTPINEINLNKIESGIENNDINIGEENYDNTRTYEVGDIVRYNEKIYKCITAITTAENFDNSKWEQTNIVEIVQSEKSKIYELIEAISTPIVGEGENITLNDTAKKRFENFDIEGNSEQETRSGKNKLNTLYQHNAGDIVTSNGITFTFNEDGSIKIQGTATSNAYVMLYGELTTYNTTMFTLPSTFTVSGGVTYPISVLGRVKTTGTYQELRTASGGTEYGNVFVQIASGQTVNTTIYPQIEEGSTASDYEQYGTSPSPDYPSEVKSCGDNINEFDKDNMDWIRNNNSNYQSTDNTNTTRIRTQTLIKLKGDETYTISGIPNGISFNSAKFYVSPESTANDYFITTSTFTVPSDATYVIFQFAGENFTDATSILMKNANIKVEKSPIATEYSEYGQGCITEVICNKNLFDKETVTNGRFVDYSTGTFITREGYCTSDYIKINSNYITISGTNEQLAFYDKDKNYISGLATSRITDIPTNAKYMIITLQTRQIDSVQIEEGSTATTYIEHQSQSYTIPTQQPMRAIRDIRDEFILKENGKWYERHYVQRLILNGTEGWNYDRNNNRFYFAKAGNKGSGYIMSSHYLRGDTTEQNNTCEIWTSAILFRDERFTEREDFINMIKAKYDAGTPVYVDYVLATPTDIECTSQQTEILNQMYIKAKSYKGVTHIYSNDAVSPNCYVEAVKDLTTLIQ